MPDAPPEFDLDERTDALCKVHSGAIYSTRKWYAPLSDKFFHLAVFQSGVEDWTSGVYTTPGAAYCDIRGQMLQGKAEECEELKRTEKGHE